MNVAVVGLGKIGLPLAVQIAGRGHRVFGADLDTDVVAAVNAGTPPFPGEADLDVRLAAAMAAGTLTAGTDTAAAAGLAEVVVVVVPLVVGADLRPDFRALDAATAAVAAGLRPGTLVSYETTLPVGTTRGRFAPALAEGSGLAVGVDLFVCHSPERVLSGRVFADLRRYPKLVGAVDEAGAARAVEFYRSVLEFDDRPDLGRPNGVWDLGSAEAAELAKVAETTYRNVNIAFANELAMMADRLGVDVGGVIDAANSQPYSHIHRPGVAVGGHCIPVYPHFMLAEGGEFPVVRAGLATNDAMPAYAVGLLESMLGDLAGLTVAVLGATYRGDVKETAFSGVFPLATALTAAGASVAVHDPLYDDAELTSLGLVPYHLGDPCDGAVVQSDHATYATLTAADLPGVRAVVDGRGVLPDEAWTGVPVRRIGGG